MSSLASEETVIVQDQTLPPQSHQHHQKILQQQQEKEAEGEEKGKKRQDNKKPPLQKSPSKLVIDQMSSTQNSSLQLNREIEAATAAAAGTETETETGTTIATTGTAKEVKGKDATTKETPTATIIEVKELKQANLETEKEHFSSQTPTNEPASKADSTTQTSKEDVNPNLQLAITLFQDKYATVTPAEVTHFIAGGDNEAKQIRTYYMNQFKWSQNLLTATRQLCAKLYLKAESQELDRILSSFTKSYLQQHPNNVFQTKNFEQIYIIIYSLILLNTSLHNPQLNKRSRISQTDFIKNTFTTFSLQQNNESLKDKTKKLDIRQKIAIENELSSFYEDLLKEELYLKGEEETGSNKRHSNLKLHINYITNSNNNTSNTSNTNINTNNNYLNNEVNGTHDKKLAETTTTTQLTQASTDQLPELSRQTTNSSIWSTDTNRRSSLAMKRLTSTTSEVSQFTANGQSSAPNQHTPRVGLARALIGHNQRHQHQHQHQQRNRIYSNTNESMTSHVTNQTSQTNQTNQTNQTLQTRSSFDHLRSVNRKSSRASIMSRETNADDTISVLSFDTANWNIRDPQYGSDQGQDMENFNVNDYQDDYDLTLELNGSPYLKEGLLKLKVLNNDANDEANAPPITPNHRFLSFFSRQPQQQRTSVGTSTNPLNQKFVENFVVVSKGELSLYSFDPKVIKKHKKGIGHGGGNNNNHDDGVGDGNWLKNAAKVGNYNLCSTFAQLEKSNQDKILWSLTFPKVFAKKNPKKFIFEAGTNEIALEFVNTCNFWASKITAIPTLEESVSSIEYGWTNLDYIISHRDNFKKFKNIQKWEPVVTGVYLSNFVANDDSNNHLGMMKQFVKTTSYYNHLKKLYNEFTKLRQKFVDNLPKSYYGGHNYTRVLNNYDAKIETYKYQLQVYRSYIIILGFALQLRFDLQSEKRKEQAYNAIDDESIAQSSISSTEDALAKVVKQEIQKLFFNMKDISKVIPTFQSSKSIKNLAEIAQQMESNKLVKSPKTYTLSNYKENESPIAQLIATSNGTSANANNGNSSPKNSPPRRLMMESVIKEEPEDFDDDDDEEGREEEGGRGGGEEDYNGDDADGSENTKIGDGEQSMGKIKNSPPSSIKKPNLNVKIQLEVSAVVI